MTAKKWKKRRKERKRKKERKRFEKSLICCAFSAFVPQSDTGVILKNLSAAGRDWKPHFLPSLLLSSLPSSLLRPLTHTRAAASHWSCKLCLRRVYAPFLPKHLLSLTNYSWINYKPFKETDSHHSHTTRSQHTHVQTGKKANWEREWRKKWRKSC